MVGRGDDSERGRRYAEPMRVSWSRRWDAALALVAAAAMVTEGLVRAEPGIWPGAYLLAPLVALPLVWRARAPLAALLAVELGAVGCVLAFDAKLSATAIVCVILYAVAFQGGRQRSLIIGAATSMVVVVAIVAVDGTVDLGGLATRIPLIIMSLTLGDTVRTRRQLRIAAKERETREAREREQESQRRIVNERLRIARELHDTLAHALVAINVRAGVAERLSASQDPSAAFGDIKGVSATALRDLRATLSLLRDSDDAVPTAPASDLGAVSVLIDHARATGLRADLNVDVDGVEIPSAVGQAAFRTVQEALTNVVRHAHASCAFVSLRTDAEMLSIEVLDDGRAGVRKGSSGHGLRGMQERATALGGWVQTGPRDEGGWRVHAVLPLHGQEPL